MRSTAMSSTMKRTTFTIAVACVAALAACGGSPGYTLRDRAVSSDRERVEREERGEPTRETLGDEASDAATDEPTDEPTREEPGSNVRIHVHTTSGTLSPTLALRTLEPHRAAIERCFVTVLGPDATGTTRASIHVEASGAARAELETLDPAIDRALPCVDAVIERVTFPASPQGRPTHVVAMIARTSGQ